MSNLKLPTRPTPAQQRKELSNSEGLTDDEIDLVLQNLENEHATLIGAGLGKQTWSRYFVENYLSKYKWYNPNRDNPDLSLSKGWAYFEHFTLPRRFLVKSGGHHVRAPPGETKETKLYSAFLTPQSSLSDWGIGVGMYFSTLSSLTVIFLLAGLLSLPNTIFYSSDAYDPDRQNNFSLLDILRFSTVCTTREWVKCDGCSENKYIWENVFTDSYYGTAIDTTTGESVTLINRTTCLPSQFKQGMWNFGVLFLLIASILTYNLYLSKLEVRFDEDNTSAPDYTLIVTNPPKDAKDPDEWREFFDTFSEKQVTLVTVALGNDELLNSLVAKRRDIKILRGLLPKGVDFSDEAATDNIVINARRQRVGEEKQGSCIAKLVLPLLRLLGLSTTEEVIWSRIKATSAKIKELEQKEYDASAVFVTFETERGQRTALEALNFSRLEVLTNKPVSGDTSAIFRDTVLNCYEASEPNAVRWKDLKCTHFEIYFRQAVTLGVTAALVVFSGWILYLARTRVSTVFFSIILSTTNVLIPLIVRMLVSYERHHREGTSMASLYIKITLFRWCNTVILTWLITPFIVTLGANSIDLINTINTLMLSEMLIAPFLRYIDITSFLDRHFFAPRAKTEEQMLACFRGGWYNMAERFTDLTKVLLLCIFFSPFYPFIYFLGAATLFLQYWMDKFLLLRSWQKAPNVGADTAHFSRKYFSTAAIVIGTIGGGYAYARSPFTFLCSCTDGFCNALPNATTFTNVTLLNNEVVGVVETASEDSYFCEQQYVGFPPTPNVQEYSLQWMTPSQERLTEIFGVFCLVVVAIYLVYALFSPVIKLALSLVKGVYEPRGIDQRKDFSSGVGVESFAYIPSLVVDGFHFPFLACDIDDVDANLIGWKDPNHKEENDIHRQYDEHNLIFDVSRERRNAVFSVVKHYPPAWYDKSK